MNRAVADEAFAYYAALGAKRSYAAVAAHLGVSRRTIVSVAKRDGWPARLAEAECKARKKLDEQLVDTLAEANLRHVKVGRFVQSRGLEALRSMAITRPADALRAIKDGVECERAVLAPAAKPKEGAIEAAEGAREMARQIRAAMAAAIGTVPPPPPPPPAGT